jgi:hypothetical protein
MKVKRLVLPVLGLALLVTASATADARSGGPGISKTGPRIDVRAPLTGNPTNQTGTRPLQIRRNLGLQVRCRYVPARDRLGVVFMRQTNCYLL